MVISRVVRKYNFQHPDCFWLDFTINSNLTRASIIRSSYLTALILFRNGRFSISAMAGIPPTPSANPPTSRAQWRFHPLTTPTEWIEDYRPGKYHPVHIGDTFNNSRYRAIRKLGYGSFSTVWLARDTQYVTHCSFHSLHIS